MNYGGKVGNQGRAHALGVLLDRDLVELLEKALEVSASLSALGGYPSSQQHRRISQRRRNSLMSKLSSSKYPGQFLLSSCVDEEKIADNLRGFAPENYGALLAALQVRSKETSTASVPAFHQGAAITTQKPFESSELAEPGDTETVSALYSDYRGVKDEEEEGRGGAVGVGGEEERGETPQDKSSAFLVEEEGREELNEASEEKSYLDRARQVGFCSNDLDGTRMQIEYWSQRLKLAKGFFSASENGEKAVDKITYLAKRTELDLAVKRKAMAALQMLTDNRGKMEFIHEDLNRGADRFMQNLAHNRDNVRPKIIHAKDHLLGGSTSPSLSGRSIEEVDLMLRNLEKEGQAQLEHRKAAKLEEISLRLKQERRAVLEEAQDFLDSFAGVGTSELPRRDRMEEEEEEIIVSSRLSQLRGLAELVSGGLQQFHSSFVNSMSASAKLALESIDSRFVVRDVGAGGVQGLWTICGKSEDETPALKNVLFLKRELASLDDSADEQNRKLCLSLMADLETRLSKEREAILAHELSAIDFLQQCVTKTEAAVKRAKFVKQMTQLV